VAVGNQPSYNSFNDFMTLKRERLVSQYTITVRFYNQYHSILRPVHV